LLTRVKLLESCGAEPNNWMSLWRRLPRSFRTARNRPTTSLGNSWIGVATQALAAERLMGDLVRRIEYAIEETERIMK